MINKVLILIFLLISIKGWTQSTEYSDEENKFVDEFMEKHINQKGLTSDEVYSKLEIGMEEVRYHPVFVEKLLTTKLWVDGDATFTYDYCERLLDNTYLSTFQSILIDPCAYSYMVAKDYEGLYNRIIPRINDDNIRGLYLAAYYQYKHNKYGTNWDEFKEHISYSVNIEYDYEILNHHKNWLLSYLFDDVLRTLELSYFRWFIEEYKEAIYSSDLPTYQFSSVIGYAVDFDNSDSDIAKNIIEHVRGLNVEKFNYLHPAIALYHFHEGRESLAIEALDKSFEMDRAGFFEAYPKDFISIESFYLDVIFGLEDFKARERLLDKALQYFKGHKSYEVRLNLLQALLLASEDIGAAKDILKNNKSYLSKKAYGINKKALVACKEFSKKKPDYRFVENVLSMMLSELYGQEFTEDLSNLDDRKALYRYIVNQNVEKPVFTLKEIVEVIDDALEEFSKGSHAGYDDFLYFKLAIIAERDEDWLKRELDKLPKDVASEFVERLNNQDNLTELESAAQVFGAVFVDYLNTDIINE